MEYSVTIPVGPILILAGGLWVGWWCWMFIDIFMEMREIERKFSRRQREITMEHIHPYKGAATMSLGFVPVIVGILLW